MGGSQGKLWRENKKDGWSETEASEMRANIADYRIHHSVQIEHFNVLLLGTPSSGKTSLRNTIGSAFSDNILKLAFAGAGGLDNDTSLTKKLSSYPVRDKKDGKNEVLKLKFWDTMGLEQKLTIQTICKIIDGEVESGTPLEGPLTKGRSAPEAKHKMHCILFVINATKLTALEETWKDMIDGIKKEANNRGVPSMVVLTHVDRMCPEVAADTRAVFKSEKIRKLIEEAAHITTFTENKIHPIRNYSKEGIKNTSIDFLTLLLVQNVVECCDEYCDKLVDDEENY